MKTRRLLTLCCLLALAACTKSSLETAFANQSEKIDKYVTAQLESHEEYRAVYEEGVVRLVIAEGEGAEAAPGDKVTFYYSGYNFNNASISAGNLFATNDEDVAAAAKWNVSDSTLFAPAVVTLGKDALVKGLEIGMKGVRAGEDCYILFSGKYGLGKKQIGTIPANAALCYHIRVEEIDN